MKINRTTKVILLVLAIGYAFFEWAILTFFMNWFALFYPPALWVIVPLAVLGIVLNYCEKTNWGVPTLASSIIIALHAFDGKWVALTLVYLIPALTIALLISDLVTSKFISKFFWLSLSTSLFVYVLTMIAAPLGIVLHFLLFHRELERAILFETLPGSIELLQLLLTLPLPMTALVVTNHYLTSKGSIALSGWTR